MEHALSGAPVTVEHDAVSLLGDPLPPGDLGSGANELTYQRLLVGSKVVAGGHVLARNHQNMGRRLGVDVAERHPVVPFSDELRVDLPGSHLAEEAVLHLHPRSSPGARMASLVPRPATMPSS